MSFDIHLQAAELVIKRLQDRGFEGYVVGGAVRDMLLGREPKDFDVVTNASPNQVLEIMDFGQSQHIDPAQAFGVTKVKVSVGGVAATVEVTTYRRDVEAHLGRKLTRVEFAHIEDDLERRDFTINALALDLGSNFLVDLHDGVVDLENKIIRFIGDPEARINEDPLRILRAVRFRNQLAFQYEAATELALLRAIEQGRLRDIAVDRVREELTRMLTHPSRRVALEDMYNLGIIQTLLPELAACVGVAQPSDHHSEGDVWVHTLCAADVLPEHPGIRLAWATVLHDIGKAVTVSQPNNDHDRIHFDNHFRVGADMTRHILSRLHFSKKMQDEITWLVHYHLITDSFPQMKQSRRYYYMSHPAFNDLLELHKADVRGSHSSPDTKDSGEAEINRLEAEWEEYRKLSEQSVPSLKQALGVDGHWLQSEFSITKSLELGDILEQLQEAFLDGDIKSQEDATNFVKKILANRAH